MERERDKLETGKERRGERRIKEGREGVRERREGNKGRWGGRRSTGTRKERGERNTPRGLHTLMQVTPLPSLLLFPSPPLSPLLFSYPYLLLYFPHSCLHSSVFLSILLFILSSPLKPLSSLPFLSFPHHSLFSIYLVCFFLTSVLSSYNNSIYMFFSCFLSTFFPESSYFTLSFLLSLVSSSFFPYLSLSP